MAMFLITDTATSQSSTLSLHDALPICRGGVHPRHPGRPHRHGPVRSVRAAVVGLGRRGFGRDRKRTRLNSSHVEISYAVFCLKKKMKTTLQRNGKNGQITKAALSMKSI